MRKVKIGKRTLVVAVLMAVLCVGVAYGALVNYLSNKATVTTTVESPIVVSGTILYGKGVLRWSEDDGVEACTLAADRLVALQSLEDFGWAWDVTNATGHSPPSGYNLYGVTALGLIDAYLLTGNESYLVAAENVGDYITYGDPTKGDFWIGYDSYGWGYSFDYRFLIRLAEVSDNSSYREYALAAWQWQKTTNYTHSDGTPLNEIYGYGCQETMYNRMAGNPNLGPSFAVWQASDYGLAALEMGDVAWAFEMAEVIAGHIDEIFPETDNCEIIGWGKALELLSAVDPLTYEGEINALIGKLKEAQEPDGHWDGGQDAPTQDTAYAILGLLKAGELDMAQKGAYWLVTHQGYQVDETTIEGGWLQTDNTEYSEITSEALQAIANTLLGELKAGDTIIAIGTERNLANNPVTSVVAVVIPAPSEWGEEGWTETGEELTLYWRYPEALGWTEEISFGPGWKTATINEESYAIILVGGYFDGNDTVVAGAGSKIPAGGSVTVEVRADFAQDIALGSYTLYIVAVNPGTSLEEIPAAAGLQ